jgi:hypothetical protein
MHLQAALTVLAAACQLVHASPAAEDLQVNKGLRLIKTSEEDPGRWVTEDEKDKLVVAGKYVGFIDITDIKVRLRAWHQASTTDLSIRMRMFSPSSPPRPTRRPSRPVRSSTRPH